MYKRIIVHVLGFIILALGIAALITSRLGSSPADAYHYFLSEITPLSIGMFAILTSFTLAFIAFIIERNKDIIIGFLFSVILGSFIDIWLDYLFKLIDQSFLDLILVRIILAVVALILIALGTAMTLITNLPTSPYDRMMVILNKKTNNISLSKLILESTFMVLALSVGFIATKLNPSVKIWDQIFIFSFLLMIFIGPIIQLFVHLFNKFKRKEELLWN